MTTINKIKKILYLAKERVKLILKKYVFVDEVFVSRQKFKMDNARLDLRSKYPLEKDSLVFDLGGYTGEWAKSIWDKYNCNIYIFEPIDEFLNIAKQRLGNNPKIHYYNFGISDKDSQERITNNKNASSIFGEKGDTVIELKDIKKVIDELGIKKIDLMKLNIEGGEFKVLPRMIETGLIPLCADIQVQFHDFYPNAKVLRGEIREALRRTHHLTYDYPFTFENWRKNDRF